MVGVGVSTVALVTGQEQTIPCVEGQETFPSLALRGFEGLGLIQHHELKVHTLEVLFIGDKELIRGDEDVEGSLQRYISVKTALIGVNTA